MIFDVARCGDTSKIQNMLHQTELRILSKVLQASRRQHLFSPSVIGASHDTLPFGNPLEWDLCYLRQNFEKLKANPDQSRKR